MQIWREDIPFLIGERVARVIFHAFLQMLTELLIGKGCAAKADDLEIFGSAPFAK